MFRKQAILRGIATIASVAVLLAPAIWNHFPLLQYDTGGYFVRWYEGYLVPSRSTVFGLFLNVSAYPDFWPAVLIQAALTVWIIALVMRALGLGERPWLLLGVIATLSAASSLPWLTSVLLTDIFAGIAVLCTYLLIFANEATRPWERVALVTVLAFSIASHSATLAVILVLIGAAVFAWRYWCLGSAGGIARSVGAVALGAIMLLGANYVVARQLAWTPGGVALSFGRMLQDGIVTRYLNDHCPDPHLRLCPYRSLLPEGADAFFWGDVDAEGIIFNKLGRFAGLNDEMTEIVLGSLRDYPLLQLETAVADGVRQLGQFATGEGMVNIIWHTYWAIDTFAPAASADMRAARQQRGELTFTIVNRINEPVAIASMLLLIMIARLGWRQRRFSDLGQFAAVVATALLANAFVCGVLSNPHDRYGARVVWLAPLIVVLLFCRLAVRRWNAGRSQRELAGVSSLPVVHAVAPHDFSSHR